MFKTASIKINKNIVFIISLTPTLTSINPDPSTSFVLVVKVTVTIIKSESKRIVMFYDNCTDIFTVNVVFYINDRLTTAGYGNDYLPWLYTQPLQNIGGC
jgi:hypothetical protein